VWAALGDPERLGRTLPGVDAVDVDDPDSFRAVVRLPTDLGVTPFAMGFRVEEREEPSRLRIAATGVGGEHRVDLTADLELRPRDDGTEISWTCDARFFGVLSAVGQRVLPGVVQEQVQSVVEAAAVAAGSAR
jgi:carbon monoxide dehydrogenase subunit G